MQVMFLTEADFIKYLGWYFSLLKQFFLDKVNVFCADFFLKEAGFPNAVGLKYVDNNNDDPMLLLSRNGRFIPPEDGWSKAGRVYIPQEVSFARALGSSK